MDRDVVERGLAIMVPEAEAFIRSFRAQYSDQSNSTIPAHISINHPFSPSVEKVPRLEESLTDLFAGFSPFQFSLTEVCRFPNVLYLVPQPERRFRELIDAVAEWFPESPPYEGQFEDVIPHLTVAYLEDAQEIGTMYEELVVFAEKELPIIGVVSGVLLIEKIGGEWQERQAFQLKG